MAQPSVIVNLAIIWQGNRLDDDSLSALRDIGEGYPHLLFTHYICPAYFTRGENVNRMRDAIAPVIKSGDEVGLVAYCWDSLLAECGLSKKQIRDAPSWNGENRPSPTTHYMKQVSSTGRSRKTEDYGYSVPLAAYDAKDVKKIILGSKSVLLHHLGDLFEGECNTFKAGGWMANDVVFEVLNETLKDPASAFERDTSAGPGVYFERILSDEDGRIPFHKWAAALWGSAQSNRGAEQSFLKSLGQKIFATHSSEPQNLLENQGAWKAFTGGIRGVEPDATSITQPARVGGVLELPDTGGSVELASVPTLRRYIERAQRLTLARSVDTYISMSITQETAQSASPYHPNMTNLQCLLSSLSQLRVPIANEGQPPYIFLSTRQAAARWTHSQGPLRRASLG